MLKLVAVWVVKQVMLRFLAITPEQWQRALDLVEQAAMMAVDNVVKNEWVKSQLKAFWPSLEGVILNALVEVALIVKRWLGMTETKAA